MVISSFSCRNGLQRKTTSRLKLHVSVEARQRRAGLFSAVLAASLIVIGCGAASAADLPNSKEPPLAPPVPPPVFSWTGFYAGVNGGFGIDHASFPYAITIPAGYVQGRSGLTENGPAFGGQVGYNYQFSGGSFLDNFVIGVEAGADWSNIDGNVTTSTPVGPATFGTRIQNFGYVAGRVGYGFGRLLLYIEGGTPFATTESYYTVGEFSGSKSVFRVPIGSIYCGAGTEYAVTNNWSVKAEYSYNYVRAGWDNFSPIPDSSIGFMSRVSFHVARIGVNYHFNLFDLPGPVVPKY